MSENQEQREEKRVARPLKDLLKKQAAGDLDDLSAEEVQELTAYTRFATQADIEAKYSAELDAMAEAMRLRLNELQAAQQDRLAALERQYIGADFLAELKRIDEQAGGTNEQS